MRVLTRDSLSSLDARIASTGGGFPIRGMAVLIAALTHMVCRRYIMEWRH
jgi:hypothetical protein